MSGSVVQCVVKAWESESVRRRVCVNVRVVAECERACEGAGAQWAAERGYVNVRLYMSEWGYMKCVMVCVCVSVYATVLCLVKCMGLGYSWMCVGECM